MSIHISIKKNLFSGARKSLAIFALSLIFLPDKTVGQQTFDLPTVIKPSPQSEALTRYGDYPMAGFDGLTDITVPLYTVTGRKLSLPVTMSFHASGRMANETNGILGMRWTLNCGGLVTRTMKGAPDEWNRVVPNNIDFSNQAEPTFETLYRSCPSGKILHALDASPGIFDTEFDIFDYSLPNGKTGHFILKNQNGEKKAMTIPYEALKIKFDKAATDFGFIESLTITDEDGTKYIFGKIDATTANAVEWTNEFDLFNSQLGGFPTAWYLTKVVSSDGTDQISFSYNTRNVSYTNASQSTSVYDRLRDDNTNWYTYLDLSPDPYTFYLKGLLYTYHFQKESVYNQSSNSNVPTMAGIQFAGGSVSMDYLSGNGNLLLNEMVFNRGTTAYKKIKFSTSKHAGESDVYYLNDMSFYGENQAQMDSKYSFSYYEGQYSLPRFKDWWGYACSGDGLNNLIPSQNIQAVPMPSTSPNQVTRDVGYQSVPRDADFNGFNIKTGMLKSIVYPTGGQTEFIYECNKYSAPAYQAGQNQSTLDGPGLRIKEVVSKPLAGKNLHKVYRYGLYEDGRGFINELLRPGSASRGDLTVAEGNAMHFWKPGVPELPLNAQYQTGYRTRDYFSDPYISFDLGGSPIKYDAVTEYYMDDNNVPQQKTQSRYSWGNDEQLSNFIIHDNDLPFHNIRKFSDPRNAWLTPVLSGKSVYRYSGGQFSLAKNQTYVYSNDVIDEAWDMPTYLHTNIAWSRTDDVGQPVPMDNYNAAQNYHTNNCSVYGYGFRKYATGKQALVNSTVDEYTPTGTITTQQHNEYEPLYHFLSSEESTNSKNETIKTTYSYPHNFIGQQPYSDMVNLRNILSPVIQQTTSKGGSVLQSIKTNYQDWGNNIIAPVTVESTKGANPTETRLHYYAYDATGNILTVAKENGVLHSYLWGYDNTYPVAEVVGADYYTLGQYVSPSSVQSPTDDATLRNQLAPLRNIPNALATTYTYRPLTGMTSQVLPNGITTYFEYDPMGRLSLARDKDNNILKKYEYNMGQCASCGSSAQWQPTGNTRYVPCTANPTFNSDLLQIEERDANVASPSYNQVHWIDQGALPHHDENLWVNTATPPRCVQFSNQNTGQQEQEQVYTNPCSDWYNQTRWVASGTNTTACPIPLSFTSSDQSGNYYSSVCSSPAQPDAIYVSVPAGQFTSNISVADANQQASTYAQAYADQHGPCTVPPFDLTFYNDAANAYTVTLTNTSTNIDYTLNVPYGSNAVFQNLPQGIYDIYIEPATSNSNTYQAGCSYFTSSSSSLWLYGIPLNSGCNTIYTNNN